MFSIFKGTIFEHSPTELRKWFYAVHLFLNAKKGVSAMQLQREIGVTYKCAWRILHQIHKAMSKDNDDNEGGNGMLFDIVDADECYIDVKDINNLKEKNDKAVLFGMLQRGGRVKAWHVDSAKYGVLGKKILDNTKEDTTISTDCFSSYDMLYNFRNHKTINHSDGEYVVGDIYTNGIEGFWGTLKRDVIGVYHHVSKKYLQNYVGEFCFRYNHRENASAMDVLLGKSILSKNEFEYSW
jgi:transposase-like protein